MTVEEWKQENPPIRRKPITNADHTRSMTDEELASFFIDLMKGSCPKPTSECFGECEACWLDWLKEIT